MLTNDDDDDDDDDDDNDDDDDDDDDDYNYIIFMIIIIIFIIIIIIIIQFITRRETYQGSSTSRNTHIALVHRTLTQHMQSLRKLLASWELNVSFLSPTLDFKQIRE
ncbi:hypothetical protein DPMN_087391 [Dreissena polymorpha]|uniref:Uncharacterized protein n=1 Tax=Dreissena polymorpha TaxID=45954 RepID=A0A9D4KSB4_DREPO|nr:hypothetical protein DPMN_087391 [Dreissena polymorpha]